MKLKERILKEMVIDKETLELIKSIWKSLPVELQTYENFEKIEKQLKKLSVGWWKNNVQRV